MRALLAGMMLASACGGSAAQPIAESNTCVFFVGGFKLDDPTQCDALTAANTGCVSCTMNGNTAVLEFDGRAGPPIGVVVPAYGSQYDRFATGYSATATQLSPTTYSVTWTLNGEPQTAKDMLSSTWDFAVTPLSN